jgi:hypothetical protein
LNDDKEDILVDSVWEADGETDEFPGLYPPGLPRFSTFSPSEASGASSTYLVLSTQWRSQLRIITVDAATGKVVSHTPLGTESHRLLGTDGHSRVVAVHSTPLSPPRLVQGQVGFVNGKIIIDWQTVKAWTPSLPKDVEGTDTL